MKENNIEEPSLTTPKEISDLLIEITGVNIFEKTRARNVIELRAFFCFLLKEKFYLGPTAISNFIRNETELTTYNHATAIHSLKKFHVYRLNKKEYFKKLESYFNITPGFISEKKSNVANLLNQYMIIKNNYYHANIKIKGYEKQIEELKVLKKQVVSGFTENEMLYRELDKQQMKIYDERVSVILKSFNWQKPKDEYEIINCST